MSFKKFYKSTKPDTFNVNDYDIPDPVKKQLKKSLTKKDQRETEKVEELLLLTSEVMEMTKLGYCDHKPPSDTKEKLESLYKAVDELDQALIGVSKNPTASHFVSAAFYSKIANFCTENNLDFPEFIEKYPTENLLNILITILKSPYEETGQTELKTGKNSDAATFFATQLVSAYIKTFRVKPGKTKSDSGRFQSFARIAGDAIGLTVGHELVNKAIDNSKYPAEEVGGEIVFRCPKK